MKLYFVTSNRHKFEEVLALVKELESGIQLEPLGNIRKLEIQGDSLDEIVLFAAENVTRDRRVHFDIEDAGLFIDALRGFPGPYSNYVYRTIGCEGILRLMNGITNRNAEFRSIIALCFRGIIKVFRGVCKGKISNEVRGHFGFGFDPIFIPEGSQKTFGEMSTAEKNMHSHRAKAVKLMIEFIRTFIK